MSDGKFITVVDAIETACGDALTPKMFGRYRKFNATDRKRIAEAHYNYEKRVDEFSVPARATHEIFPYVHPRWTIDELLGGRGYERLLTNEDSAIKTLLLYYHRIALNDGFSYLCDLYRLAPQDADTDAKFDAYLRLFTTLRPLIQEGIVSFLPEMATYMPAERAVRNLPNVPGFEEHFADNADFFNFVFRRFIEESLWIGKQFNLDLLFPTPQSIDFFNAYNELCTTRIPKTKVREASLGPMLLSAELPQLEKLSISDIVNVRKNDEGFSSWRSALRKVMQACYQDYSVGNIDGKEFRRIAHEEMAEGRARVQEAIKRSHHLDLVQSAAKSIGVGIFATAISTPNTFNEGVTKAVSTAGGTFLLDYVIGKKKANKQNVLLSHYAIFNMNTSPATDR